MNRVAKTLSLVAILLTLASETAWAAIEWTTGSVSGDGGAGIRCRAPA